MTGYGEAKTCAFRAVPPRVSAAKIALEHICHFMGIDTYAIVAHNEFPCVDTRSTTHIHCRIIGRVANGIIEQNGNDLPQSKSIAKDDDFAVVGREFYWLRRRLKERMGEPFPPLEKAISVPGTMRSITTVRKLAAKYCGDTGTAGK